MKTIAIIYPKADYTAEEVAYKLELNLEWVYIVPRREFRNENVTKKKLDKVKYALFIAFEDVKLDPTTKKDINYLKQNNKTIIAIISKDHKMQFPADVVYEIDHTSIADVFHFVYSILGEMRFKDDNLTELEITKALIPILALKLKPKP
jgi:hypothetical protein